MSAEISSSSAWATADAKSTLKVRLDNRFVALDEPRTYEKGMFTKTVHTSDGYWVNLFLPDPNNPDRDGVQPCPLGRGFVAATEPYESFILRQPWRTYVGHGVSLYGNWSPLRFLSFDWNTTRGDLEQSLFPALVYVYNEFGYTEPNHPIIPPVSSPVLPCTYTVQVTVTDQIDGFIDSDSYQMHVMPPVVKSRKYAPDYEGDLRPFGFHAVRIASLTNGTDDPIVVTSITITESGSETWRSEITYDFGVSAQSEGFAIQFGESETVSTEVSFTRGTTITVRPIRTLQPGEYIEVWAVPKGRVEHWVVERYGESGFITEGTVRDFVRPRGSPGSWDNVIVVGP